MAKSEQSAASVTGTHLSPIFTSVTDLHLLHRMHYNFVRLHRSLRVTPAMAANVTDRLWEIADIAKLVEDAEAAPKARGPYKKLAA